MEPGSAPRRAVHRVSPDRWLHGQLSADPLSDHHLRSCSSSTSDLNSLKEETGSSGRGSLEDEDLHTYRPKIPLSRAKMGGMTRNQSELEGRLAMDYMRKELLTKLREFFNRNFPGGYASVESLEKLLLDPEFTTILFRLFDSKGQGYLVQVEWIDSLKSSAQMLSELMELAELLEAIAYVVCGDNNIDPDSFHKIMSSRGMAKRILVTCKSSKEKDLGYCVQSLMETLMLITCRDEDGQLKDKQLIARLTETFKNQLGPDKHFFTLEEFRKIIPCKDDFFCRRIFDVFDSDQSGTVTMTELVESMLRFSNTDNDTKIQFLFKVYDADNNKLLTEDEYREVIRACMRENGMQFNEIEVSNLANAIFQDGVDEGHSAMTLEDFRNQMLREEGLLNNLTLMFSNWIIPNKQPKKKSFVEDLKRKLLFRHLSADYWQNNFTLIIFIFMFAIVNLILFIHRSIYFKDFSMLSGYTPNYFYVISRGCGRTLLFNSVFIVLLVLRYSITLLRKLGLAGILPLDHNIYLHKMVGTVIFVQASIHSIMHLLNFAINIQPDPVKFVQITAPYWNYTGKPMVGYEKPDGCKIVDINSDLAQYCDEDSKRLPEGLTLPNVTITVCQMCLSGKPWEYADWMLTTKPGMLGLVDGIANPTGLALMSILSIMFICSLPAVRRSGHFQVFYLTHMLYFVYFVLLILHAPEFWKWFLFPSIIWVAEGMYRFLSSFLGHGKTFIRAGVLLPSKVTNLIINRPEGFRFSPGDWVFIKIPAVAKSEWHPFTISSAPEVEGEFTLHIRGVGGWTNKLYEFFETEYTRQHAGTQRTTSAIGQMYGSVKRKFTKSVKYIVTKTRADTVDNTFMQAVHGHALDLDRQRERMNKRAAKLKKMSMEHVHDEDIDAKHSPLKSVRYLSMRQKVIRYDTPEQIDDHQNDEEQGQVVKEVGRTALLEEPLQVFIDGPFGSPSSNIYRAQHAVLIGTGIGITPFASILQSIMHRYWSVKQTCPRCRYAWSDKLQSTMMNLKKVDFFWINRDQKSFEWFVNLLSQLELEQAVHGGEMDRFLDMHMYVTSALQRTDMKAVSLQLALDILHRKEDRDLITGLKARTNAGRPNWDKVFTKLRAENRGDITVFYCGNPTLAKVLRSKCEQFGFKFRKEVF